MSFSRPRAETKPSAPNTAKGTDSTTANGSSQRS